MYHEVLVKYWLNLTKIENGINQYLTDNVTDNVTF